MDQVFHPGEPRGAEERKAIQFYGLAAPRAGTCPVHEFWNERLHQQTVHAGEPWEGERRGQKLFHAYPVEHVRTPGEETHRIASGVHRPLHTMHLLTPLRLALWLGGPTYAEVRLHSQSAFAHSPTAHAAPRRSICPPASLAEGYSTLWSKGEPSPLGCQREAAAAPWCLPHSRRCHCLLAI